MALPWLFWFWLAVVLGPITCIYVYNWLIVPLILKSRHRQSTRPKYNPVTADRLTPEAREFVGAVLREFVAEGFEILSHVAVDGTIKNVSATAMLLVNRTTCDVASIITTRTKGLRQMVYSIRSHFADEVTITTGFNRSIGIFPMQPDIDGSSLSWESRAAALVEFHRRRVEQSGRTTTPRSPLPIDGIQYFEEEMRRTSDWIVRCGYNYRERATGDLRQTFKGAYLTAWKLMEPVKSWRIRRRDLKARNLWRELGMDDWRVPEMPPLPAELVPTVTAPVPPSFLDSGLRYEASLQLGEIRSEQTDAGLTMRIGMPGRLARLGQSWQILLSFMFFSLLLALQMWIAWRTFNYMVRFGPAYISRHSFFGYSFYILAILLALQVFKLVRVLLFARGTITLIANYAGLAYHNIAWWSPTGFVQRSEIESLRIRRDGSTFRKTYVLALRKRGSRRRLPLFSARDFATVNGAKTALAVALGIELAEMSQEDAQEAAVT